MQRSNERKSVCRKKAIKSMQQKVCKMKKKLVLSKKPACSKLYEIARW